MQASQLALAVCASLCSSCTRQSAIHASEQTQAIGGTGYGGSDYGGGGDFFIPISSTGIPTLDGQLCAFENPTWDSCTACCEEVADLNTGEPLGEYYAMCADECDDDGDDGEPPNPDDRLNDIVRKLADGAIATVSFLTLMKANGFGTVGKCQDASTAACTRLFPQNPKPCLEVTLAACLTLPTQ